MSASRATSPSSRGAGALPRRDGAAASSGGVGPGPTGWQGVLGHASHRVKTRAVFWPPNPNELLRATRMSRCDGDVRGQVEALAGRVGVGQVDRRRDAALADGQDRGDGLDRAGRAEGVPEHRLVGGHRDPPGVVAEDRPDGLQLGLVALRRRGRVGVDVVDVGRRQAGLLERPPRRADGADATRRRQRDVRGIGRRAVADELGQRLARRGPRRARAPRGRRTPAALAADEPVAPAIERPRGRRRVVVAGRQRAHRGEPADERLEDAGLRRRRRASCRRRRDG